MAATYYTYLDLGPPIISKHWATRFLHLWRSLVISLLCVIPVPCRSSANVMILGSYPIHGYVCRPVFGCFAT